ncbi:MAG: succinyldiaminopimelate transaminase [Campylobacterales bacterium]
MRFETYPFEKLTRLLEGITPPAELAPMALTIGEPQFPTPQFILDEFAARAGELRYYPKSGGEEFLHTAQRAFVARRFGVTLSKDQLIPTFGTREVLFNLPQYLLFDKTYPVMAFPNPFYQIYEGAAIASRARIIHLPLLPESGFKPVIDEHELAACDLVILNSPSNPTAAVMTLDELCEWARLSAKYGFILINDECYSEIYSTTPPPSLLEAAKAIGNDRFENILVLNSISKRSNAPGLRSGFVAGDASILAGYRQYRTYVGAAIPLPLQHAAAVAWSDESHVAKAREAYRENFVIAEEILGVAPSLATFYLWLFVNDDLEAAKKLYQEANLKVLPGSFLGRNKAGEGYVRLALVYEPARTREALTRFASVMKGIA